MLQSSSSEEKLVKPLKNRFYAQFAQKKHHYGPHAEWKTIFSCKRTKADH